MKTSSALFAIVVGFCAHASAQLQLNQGDTVTFHVDYSMFIPSGTAVSAFPVRKNFAFSLNYDASTLNAGDVLYWEAFGVTATLTMDDPRNSNINFPYNGLNGEALQINPEDFQGDFRLTMQSGSMVLNNISVGMGVPIDRNSVNVYSAIVPVPEPGVISLICLTGVLLPAARYFSRRHR